MMPYLNETMVGHIVLGIVVLVLGLSHRRDLKRIVIEFKNGKNKNVDTK